MEAGLHQLLLRRETTPGARAMAVSTPKWRKSRAEDDIRIMCVGLTVVDLITTIERYPEEDSDQRSVQAK